MIVRKGVMLACWHSLSWIALTAVPESRSAVWCWFWMITCISGSQLADTISGRAEPRRPWLRMDLRVFHRIVLGFPECLEWFGSLLSAGRRESWISVARLGPMGVFLFCVIRILIALTVAVPCPTPSAGVRWSSASFYCFLLRRCVCRNYFTDYVRN